MPIQPVQHHIKILGADAIGSANGGDGKVVVGVMLLPSLPDCLPPPPFGFGLYSTHQPPSTIMRHKATVRVGGVLVSNEELAEDFVAFLEPSGE